MILKKTDNHVDIASIIPGTRLIDMINYTIKYCQENDVTAKKETHRLRWVFNFIYT